MEAVRKRIFTQFALYILFHFIGMLVEVPLIRVVEQAACYQHFNQKMEESQCKIPAVQDTLSSVLGWQILFDALPCM